MVMKSNEKQRSRRRLQAVSPKVKIQRRGNNVKNYNSMVTDGAEFDGALSVQMAKHWRVWLSFAERKKENGKEKIQRQNCVCRKENKYKKVTKGKDCVTMLVKLHEGKESRLTVPHART